MISVERYVRMINSGLSENLRIGFLDSYFILIRERSYQASREIAGEVIKRLKADGLWGEMQVVPVARKLCADKKLAGVTAYVERPAYKLSLRNLWRVIRRSLFLVILGSIWGFGSVSLEVHRNPITMPPESALAEKEEMSEWEVFVRALIHVESSGDSTVTGPTGDAGIFQITPVYVADVNRILGEKRFTLDDRFSAVQSRKMFDIFQRHYNPSQSISRAIRLHNPGAGEWYGKRIRKEMNRIKTEGDETI